VKDETISNKPNYPAAGKGLKRAKIDGPYAGHLRDMTGCFLYYYKLAQARN
jgi:hypothetical protein